MSKEKTIKMTSSDPTSKNKIVNVGDEYIWFGNDEETFGFLNGAKIKKLQQWCEKIIAASKKSKS